MESESDSEWYRCTILDGKFRGKIRIRTELETHGSESEPAKSESESDSKWYRCTILDEKIRGKVRIRTESAKSELESKLGR